MINIDRQIEQAKRKPMTAENLNQLGDLFMKKGDKQLAVAYFYEALDKLHFAQKEKKMAICKKIIKISPNSEKAYEGIIEILSKMGLVIEEKKYLHMLARICEEKGDREKADELYLKIKELDPHVSIPGTFFYRSQEQPDIQGPSSDAVAAPDIPDKHAGKEQGSSRSDEMRDRAERAATEMAHVSGEKLIEASLEEIADEVPSPRKVRDHKRYVPKKYIFMVLPVIILAAVLFFFMVPGTHETSPTVGLPFSSVVDNIEIHVSMIEDISEISGVVPTSMMKDLSFAAVSFRSLDSCLPDAFASSPPDMISLLDQNNNVTEIRAVEGLQKLLRVIYKASVCGKENGIVFVRLVIPMQNDTSYSGLAVRIPDKNTPILLKWNVQ
jgi:hypothetical protein